MDISKSEEKLKSLRERLQLMETEETEKIRQKRILADMGDDYRENEGAKLVMEDHEFLHMRITNIKREIYDLKKKMLFMTKKQV